MIVAPRRVRARTHHSPAQGCVKSRTLRRAGSSGATFTSPRNPPQTLGNPTSPQDIHKENQHLILRNLGPHSRFPLCDSPDRADPFLTGPDRKTPDGRSGLRARAGEWRVQAGRDPESKRTNATVVGPRPVAPAGKRAMRLRRPFGSVVATGVRKGLWMGRVRQRADLSGRRQGGRKTMQGPRPSTWRLF